MAARKTNPRIKLATNIALIAVIVFLLIFTLLSLSQQAQQRRYLKVRQGLQQDFRVVLPNAQWQLFVNEENLVTIRADLAEIRSPEAIQQLIVKIKEGVLQRYPLKYIRLVQVDIEGRRGKMVKAIDFILER